MNEPDNVIETYNRALEVYKAEFRSLEDMYEEVRDNLVELAYYLSNPTPNFSNETAAAWVRYVLDEVLG